MYPLHETLLDWQALSRSSDEQFASFDLAAVNLACARGLPGGENIDVGANLTILDRCAEHVRAHTAQMRPHFERNPDAFCNSWALYRIADMVTVLQRDFGFHYRQQLLDADDDAFFARAEHLFIHGVLQGNTGSCASLPVVFIAIGRRLGYPLKLVTTAGHLFARWEGDGLRFNIECTSRGLNTHSDDYYRIWPKRMCKAEIKDHGHLVSLTPRQELANFISARGHCLVANKRWREGVLAHAHACELDPKCRGQENALVRAMNFWDKSLRPLLMVGFPSLEIFRHGRWFPSIRQDLDAGIAHLCVKEWLLTYPEFERRWWGPLRRHETYPAGLPAHIVVEYPPNSMDAPRITLHMTPPPGYLNRPHEPA